MPNPCPPLSQRTVDALQWEGRRRTIRDSEVRGLCVRVSRHSNSYALQREHQGKTLLLTLGDTRAHRLKDARAWALKMQAMFAQGIDPRRPKIVAGHSTVPTLGKAWDARIQWLEAHRQPATVAHSRQYRARFEDWMDMALTDISTEMIRKRHSELSIKVKSGKREIGGKATADHSIKVFSETWNWYSEAIEKLPESPVPTRYLKHNVKSKPKGMNPAELAEWSDAIAGKPREQMLLFALFSGLRRRTLLELRWDWIGWQRIEIPGDAMKSGRPFDLPLSTQLYLILDRVPKLCPVRIFPFAGTRIKGLTHGHALRHTYRTQGAAAGVPTAFLDALMDHRAAALGSVYQNDAALFDALLKAQQEVSNRLAEFVEV